jgi:hypothetical protein
MGNAYKTLVGNPEGKSQLDDLDVNGRVILKWILEIMIWGCGLDSSGSEL